MDNDDMMLLDENFDYLIQEMTYGSSYKKLNRLFSRILNTLLIIDYITRKIDIRKQYKLNIEFIIIEIDLIILEKGRKSVFIIKKMICLK